MIAAWVITAPASGAMAALLYFVLSGMLMPQVTFFVGVAVFDKLIEIK